MIKSLWESSILVSTFISFFTLWTAKVEAANLISNPKFSVKPFSNNVDLTLTETLSQEITFEVVPEPLTILGSLTAIGIGVALKKKHSRKLQEANAKA